MKKRLLSLVMALAMICGFAAWVPGFDINANAGATLVWPVPGTMSYKKVNNYHNGNAIDISGSDIAGYNVVAAMGGTVIAKFLCGSNHWDSPTGDGLHDTHTCHGFGNGIVIQGDDGRIYQYAHMQAGSIPSGVYNGAYVSAGQNIGKVGMTGYASGYHLHFGISKGEYWYASGINPYEETYVDGTIPEWEETLGSVVNLGDNFYARIEHQSSGLAMTDQAPNVACETSTGSNNQIWHFIRQSNGAYAIQSYATGAYMDVYGLSDEDGTNLYTWPNYTGANNQQFFIHNAYGAYYIRPALSEKRVLDMDSDSHNVSIWALVADWKPQKFNIERIDLNGSLPAGLGADIYAIIEHQSTGLLMTDQGDNVACESSNGTNNQIWRFIRQSNGAYAIQNLATGGYMDVYGLYDEDNTNVYTWPSYTGANNQQFYIHGAYGACYIRPALSNKRVLDMDADTHNISIWATAGVDWDWAPQKFTIRRIDLGGNFPVDLGTNFYANITNSDSKKILSYNPSISDLIFEDANNGSNQTWYFIKQNDGSYMIKILDNNAYIDVSYSGTTPGTNVGVSTPWDHDNPAQKWFIYGEQGKYKLIPQCATLALSSMVTKLGIYNAQLEKYTGNSSQLLEINKLCDKNEGIHSYNDWVVNKKATCEENGQKQHECIWCGDIEKEVINKLGHNYVETVVAPTCTAKGYTNHKCSRCGDEYNDTETDMIAHKFGKWTVTTKPTCTAKGVETRTCSECKKTETRDVNALGHDYKATVVAPTCTAKGYTNHKCTRCKDEYNDTETQMTAHRFGDWRVTTAPTCTAKGVETRTCSECKKTETRDVNALGHDYVASIVSPTCTSKGYTNHKCSRCEDEYNDNEVDMLAHSFGDWRVTTAPTCTAKGVETRTCSECKKTETRDVNALGHDYVASIIPPTCQSKGYTLHKCLRCNDEYKDNETDKAAHSFGKWTTTVKPTCTAKGSETRICSVCKVSETREIKALGHDYVASLVSANCNSKGYTLYKCSRCGDEIKDNYTEPTGNHRWSEWKTTAFDVAKGTSTQTRTCSTCNKTESKTTEKAIQRLAGAGRYATATAISQAAFDKADTVILAYSMNYADALAGVSLATKMNAPILLTNLKTLPAETLAEIKRLKAKNVIILGGTGAVGAEVETALIKEGFKTERIAGATRFETATKIAEKMQKFNDKAPEEVYFVYAFNSADALSVSPIAACKNAPIIYLTTKGELNADTAAYLAKLKKAGSVKNAYVIGGEGVISNDMMKKAGSVLGVTPVRVFGANRFETCVAVNERFADVLDGDMLCVATGMDFPDALAGGVYAAINKAPLFLINGKVKTPNLNDAQKAYLKTKAAAKITAFGGVSVVPDNHIADIVKNSI